MRAQVDLRAFGLDPCSGSKRIPRKNVRPLCGKPLLQWSIDVALAAPSVDRVVVSTDDPEIAEIVALMVLRSSSACGLALTTRRACIGVYASAASRCV